MERSGPPRENVVVFEYLDVRAFLRDTYTARNAAGKPFSYRAFSMKAGLRSPNHLKRVIDGERDLTPEMAVRYATALGLDGPAAAYFCDLAAFGRAKTSAEKNAIYQRLGAFREYRRAQRLEMAHADAHANWYVPAIRELALRPDFRPDPEWIAARLLPPIRRQEAEQALETLFELGLLVRHPDGHVEQGTPVWTTGPETRGLHIGNYHRAMMTRAAASIDLIPARERDISSITFCVGPGRLADIKDRIQKFRKEIIALAADETAGDQVLQLNFQLFPLSTSGVTEAEKEKKK
ncbi:MAG: TIGR02147 family protein [Myxococcota bacterium]